ncbi:MAG: GH36-type glycosyl hydrolase domain-containing protein [Bdellovibrio bacteriovorus]
MSSASRTGFCCRSWCPNRPRPRRPGRSDARGVRPTGRVRTGSAGCWIRGPLPLRSDGRSHGAIWAAMAFAALGDSRPAWELTTLINPANHAKTPEAIATYKVEPYVMAADVYAVAPHIGRGGWTWYTGSAGWMYRLILESLLGLRLEVDRLTLAPCLPAHWEVLRIQYRYRDTVYQIAIAQTLSAGDDRGEVTRLRVDGVDQGGDAIPLADDGREHAVEITVSGRRSGAQR